MTLPPPPRLLVFDLDGTLIDSSLDLCNSVNAMLAHLHRPELPHAVIASYIGDGAAMLVRRALGDPGDLDTLQSGNEGQDDGLLYDALDYFIRYYRAHKLDNTQAYPGVLGALAEIRARAPNLLMAVLTNKPVNPSRGICDALGLAPYFFQNYGGDSFSIKKPDPMGYRRLMDEADMLYRNAHAEARPLDAGETVMIGDSDVDVLTARNCGARSVGCSFGLSPHALAAAAPDITVAHASEWPQALLPQS